MQRESASVRGPQHWNYENGRSRSGNGYIMINGNGRFREGREYEHRAIMEKHLGRRLKDEEVVHHIDGDRANNAISNLMLFPNDSEHHKYHGELKACARLTGP